MAFAFQPKMVCSLLLAVATASIIVGSALVEATWCVVRSGARPQAVQLQLDYACANGAACGPIQPGGSCFNPNTIQNHASYAFDSYYQHKGKDVGACYFGGTATIAVTDPSYGTCVYPPLNADGGATMTLPTKNRKFQDLTNINKLVD